MSNLIECPVCQGPAETVKADNHPDWWITRCATFCEIEIQGTDREAMEQEWCNRPLDQRTLRAVRDALLLEFAPWPASGTLTLDNPRVVRGIKKFFSSGEFELKEKKEGNNG